ncbi:hypothetical protein PG984_012598 [Apiospora sp. TS-2023a]
MYTVTLRSFPPSGSNAVGLDNEQAVTTRRSNMIRRSQSKTYFFSGESTTSCLKSLVRSKSINILTDHQPCHSACGREYAGEYGGGMLRLGNKFGLAI